MNEAVLTTIAITGFGVAFFHAAIPTHWLPFVLTARVQHWNHTRTLFITAIAGAGHVLFTALLGLFIAWFGIVLNEKIGDWFPRIAGIVLLSLGAFYIFRQIVTKGAPHHHLIGDHPHEHEHPPSVAAATYGVAGEHEATAPRRKSSDRVAIMSLLALLTFSPCEAFLPDLCFWCPLWLDRIRSAHGDSFRRRSCRNGRLYLAHAPGREEHSTSLARKI